MKTFALATMLLLLLTATAAAAVERHSGHVIAVDPAAGTITMQEFVEGVGVETRAVERTLRVAPSVSVELLRPAPRRDVNEWRDAWQAEPFALTALRPGDFITVITDGAQAVALDVVRPAR